MMVEWHHWLNGHEFDKLQEMMDREAWRTAVHGVEDSWTQQQHSKSQKTSRGLVSKVTQVSITIFCCLKAITVSVQIQGEELPKELNIKKHSS